VRGEGYFRALLNGERDGVADRLLLAALMPAGWAYGLAMGLRARLYAAGLLPSHRLPRPVVSVGNLTMGGTGKTPATAWLARYFLARGKRVAVLTRGYGSSAGREPAVVSDGERLFLSPAEAGDEPCLLARTVPGLLVVVGRDRYRAGLLALEQLAPDLFLLDDGFQHLRLARDLNLLLLDSRRPFGSGRVFPAGLLREPMTAVRRSDLVLCTRWQSGLPLPDVPGRTVYRSAHLLETALPLGSGEPVPLASLAGGRGLAFAGIADPEFFFAGLTGAGLSLVEGVPLPDHVPYGVERVAELQQRAERAGADFLITTEKDAVKLAPFAERLGRVYAARLDFRVLDEEPLTVALEKVLLLPPRK